MKRLFFVALLLTPLACTPSQNNEFDVQVRWTSYGIPHVLADDWASLGYGYAYATATDVVCLIARDIVMVNGEMSRYFGSDDGNLTSDVFHRAMLGPETVKRLTSSAEPDSEGFNRGYVAGYNRYLRDHADALPASCAGEPWVQPISQEDLDRLAIGVGIRYGLQRFSRTIVEAEPPGTLETEPGLPAPVTESGLGSNAIAFGREVTENGSGILFGNPHYPWQGSSRFHLMHMTIPGEVDVMGVSLATTTRVAIGFNKDIAWSHTVSTGLRYTLYELDLLPDDPMSYHYGDEIRAITATPVEVPVTQADGTTTTETRTVYRSHYGPIVMSEDWPWTEEVAYAIRDANINNDRAMPTYRGINAATSIADLETALREGQGVAWTNTIAADRHGNAFYGDISVVPNVDTELLERCRVTRESFSGRTIVLDGSKPECEWRNDERSVIEGALAPQEMPSLTTGTYVTNSNDSYWLSNPDSPLEGYSPIIGNERTARSLRTRAGLELVAEALNDGGKVAPKDVQTMLYSHRNYAAELLLDDVLELCEEKAARACSVLEQWDRTQNLDSRGAQVWTEFWREFRKTPDLFAVEFDPSDPVHTPRGIKKTLPVRRALTQALLAAEKTLDEAGIPLDAPWGEVQFAERDGERIGIPGGQGWAGMFSMIVAELEPGLGYTPIRHGNSFIQVVTWDENGNVDPRGILTYSQSQEADSEHSFDQTRLYSQGSWIDFPFTEEEIAADPELETLHLTE